MIRLGLCCIFKNEPIRFKNATAKRLLTLEREEQLTILSNLCLINLQSLKSALEFCVRNEIGCFRVSSQILPLKTHPVIGYDWKELPKAEELDELFRTLKEFTVASRLRTSFHPDQFVVLSTPHPNVLEASIKELAYQAEVSELIGGDVLNIHGGGVYGDKKAALNRLKESIKRLPELISTRLTLENDDRSYTPEDLLPFCNEMKIPLVYDVHHHRCLSDSLTVAEATGEAIKTWSREPLFHISSPREGWESPNPRFHNDFIHIEDFPCDWRDLDLTLEVEAKAKEIAIARFKEELKLLGIEVFKPSMTEKSEEL